MPYASGGATMDDDTHVIDNGWDALPEYADKSGEGDDAVTVSISTTPGEWLVNTVDSVVVPMSMAEVVDAMRAHKLTERSLVWRQGMQEWSCIDAVPQLKLAARMAPARRPPEKPSSPPTRQAPPPPKTPPPNAGLSRRSTLPFGFASPPGSRPAHAKPTLPPSATTASNADEPEVLAVYARPAATISFDLSPEQPLRAPPAKIVPQQPLTLAPTTSDSSPRSAPPPPNRYADLSVVAAADFRAVKRSSKRSVMLWSVFSAAAASLLTFWLARSEGAGAPPSAARPPEQGVALVGPAPVAAPVDLPEPPAASAAVPEPMASAAVAAEPIKPIAVKVKTPRPVARRPKPPQALRMEPITADSLVTGSSPSAGNTKSPSSEPNPYDVKLDDEAPLKAPAVQGPGLDDAPNAEASVSGSKTPGF
jgi:hypothetical protein